MTILWRCGGVRLGEDISYEWRTSKAGTKQLWEWRKSVRRHSQRLQQIQWKGKKVPYLAGEVPPSTSKKWPMCWSASSHLVALCWKVLKTLGGSHSWKDIFGIFCPRPIPLCPLTVSPLWAKHLYKLPLSSYSSQVYGANQLKHEPK